MTDPYRRPDGQIAARPKDANEDSNAATSPNSLASNRRGSRRRRSSSEQHHTSAADEVQTADGGVSQVDTRDITQSTLHDTPTLPEATNMSRSPSAGSSHNPGYASSQPPTSSTSATTATGDLPQIDSHSPVSIEAFDMDPREAYETCPLQCPVNKNSVEELETHRIVNNPKLRNDANYDTALHFRQNLDGDFGKQKVKTIKAYWLAVGYELELIESILQQLANPNGHTADEDILLREKLATCKKRLPYVFTAVKDILISLAPVRDQERIEERLDNTFLMQQIDRGMCDLVDLAVWLARLITTHCAPMRDAQVAKMLQTVVDATAAGQTKQLTDGLRQLVDIMEAMKLDVANHQIRHIRTQLIAGTVPFQKRYNTHRIRLGKINVAASREWLQEEYVRLLRYSSSTTVLDALCSALLEDMASTASFAPTFYLDNERLKGLSVEIQSFLCREVCQETLLALLGSAWEAVRALDMFKTFLSTFNGSVVQFLDDVESIAFQMSRIITACTQGMELIDESITSEACQRLRSDLCQDSAVYVKHRNALLDRLVPKLQKSVQDHVGLSTLELQAALIPKQPARHDRRSRGFGAVLEPTRRVAPSDPDQTLIQKLTHITVIHWHVWSEEYQAACEEANIQEPPSEPDIHMRNVSSHFDELCNSAISLEPCAQETTR